MVGFVQLQDLHLSCLLLPWPLTWRSPQRCGRQQQSGFTGLPVCVADTRPPSSLEGSTITEALSRREKTPGMNCGEARAPLCHQFPPSLVSLPTLQDMAWVGTMAAPPHLPPPPPTSHEDEQYFLSFAGKDN